MNFAEFPMNAFRQWLDASAAMVATSMAMLEQVGRAGPLTEQRQVFTRPAASTAMPWWMAPASPAATAPSPMPMFGSWPFPQGGAMPTVLTSSMPSPVTAAMGLWFGPAASLGAAMMPQLPLAPWLAPPARDAGVFEPFAAAYRTASGHATAAMFRAMADAVDPTPRAPTLPFWPFMVPGTRH